MRKAAITEGPPISMEEVIGIFERAAASGGEGGISRALKAAINSAMTKEQLRAWRERHFGKHNKPAAEALGMSETQFKQRLYGRCPITKTEALLCEAIDRERSVCRRELLP